MSRDARPDHPIHELLVKRWSPYAFSDRPVADADLCALFEAARWAPSSYNEQPWTFILATQQDPGEFDRLASCLVEANQVWARKAPVLAISVAHMHFSRNGKPNTCAHHDVGLAVAQLTVEATARGLVVHQMAGIVPDMVRANYQLPEGCQPLTGIAIGYAGDAQKLPDSLQDRDTAERTRKPLADFVYGGLWGNTAWAISKT